MPNLSLAQDVVSRAGSPLLAASVRTLVDPFRSGTALADVAAPLIDEPTPAGLPVWLFVLRSASLLEPADAPAWRNLLDGCAARAASGWSSLRWPGSSSLGRDPAALAALSSLWLRRCRRNTVEVDRGATGLLASVTDARSEKHIPTLCAAVAVQGAFNVPRDDAASGRARSALCELVEQKALDGLDLPLVLESAILSGAGPRDRLTRLARSALGASQDARGAFPSSRGEAASAESTWWALLLLMRGG